VASNWRNPWLWIFVGAAAIGIAASSKSTPPRQAVGQSKRRPPQSAASRRKKLATKRIFVAFAKEDERQRDFLKGQSLSTVSPFEYIDMSVKNPYDGGWKDQVRTRIRGSDGVIALISKNTPNADGELWEIRCAIEERKPLIGIWAYSDDRTRPSAMSGQQLVEWTWPAIAAFINRV